MADYLFNVARRRMATGDFDPQNLGAGLLATTGAGYNDLDLKTVADLLAVGSVAEPAAGERVDVGVVTFADESTSEANDWAAGVFPTVPFAADSGEVAVAMFVYEKGANDAAHTLLLLNDFSSTPLDGGIEIDPATDSFRITTP